MSSVSTRYVSTDNSMLSTNALSVMLCAEAATVRPKLIQVQCCLDYFCLVLLLLFWVPGTDVPRATNAMALTESFKQMKQPNCAATSPMTAVHTPI